MSIVCWLIQRSTIVLTAGAKPQSRLSSLKIIDRSFRYASPGLWNKHLFISSSTSFWYQYLYFRLTYSFTYHILLFDSPLCSSVIPRVLFHSRLKTYTCFTNPFQSSFTSSRTTFTDYCPDRFFWATRFLFFLIFSFLCRTLD